jgi:hypothetical protein
MKVATKTVKAAVRVGSLRIQLGAASYLCHVPSSVQPSRAAFEELWLVCEDVPRTPNPNDPKTYIRRKQATLGASYSFSGQRSHQLPPTTEMLELVALVNADVAKRCKSELRAQ